MNSNELMKYNLVWIRSPSDDHVEIEREPKRTRRRSADGGHLRPRRRRPPIAVDVATLFRRFGDGNCVIAEEEFDGFVGFVIGSMLRPSAQSFAIYQAISLSIITFLLH